MQGNLPCPSRLLAGRTLIEDTYTFVGADDLLPHGDVIVPLPRFIAGVEPHGKLGVQLQPSDDVRTLAGKLDGVSLVALTFNKHVEGRPYSQARILREQLGFQGDVRAVGAVLRDMIFFMYRCGINQFLLRDVEEAPDAAKSLDSFTVRYQPATDAPATVRIW